MVLLGGVHTLTGPIVGAAAYHGLEIWFSTLTRFWPLVLGLIIVALVLAFPRGIVGSLARRIRRGRGAVMAVLSVRGLPKAFGGIRAVSDVHFGVDAGELLRPDRPERRRQDHLLQLPERPDRGPTPAASDWPAASWSACRRARSGGSASGARSRSRRPSAR